MGVILNDLKQKIFYICTTHTRGGDPERVQTSGSGGKYYPHTWGWSYVREASKITDGVLPTHVGVIPVVVCMQGMLKGTTHTRGGDPTIKEAVQDIELYYPHTWGWSWITTSKWWVGKVLPTHVGVILGTPIWNKGPTRTTHTRGGDPWWNRRFQKL